MIETRCLKNAVIFVETILNFVLSRKITYLNHVINPSLQGGNRLFILSFENEDQKKSHSTYYLSNVEIKDYNVMIDGRNFFDQPINSMTKTYKNIRKIATGQGMTIQLVAC